MLNYITRCYHATVTEDSAVLCDIFNSELFLVYGAIIIVPISKAVVGYIILGPSNNSHAEPIAMEAGNNGMVVAETIKAVFEAGGL